MKPTLKPYQERRLQRDCRVIADRLQRGIAPARAVRSLADFLRPIYSSTPKTTNPN